MTTAALSPLAPAAYAQPEWLQRERRFVFARSWLFAGFAAQLARPGDFVTADAAGWPVLVYRGEEGRLRAFHNVCSHRHSELVAAPCGHGPIRCRYHGWTYDEAGRPTGIPSQRELFDLDPDQRAGLALARFSVDQCGPFVFVRLDDETSGGEGGRGPSLRDWLGEYAALLEQLGETFALPFATADHDWQANWKLGVENTLEPYHSDFVHGESLGAVAESRGEIVLAEGPRQGHSRIFHRLLPPAVKWWTSMAARAGLSPCPGLGDYHHFFLYPNLCLGLTFGALLSVQTFSPRGADACRLTSRLMLPGSTEEQPAPREAASRRVLADYLAAFNLQVLEEDRGPVEACQRGVGTASRRALLGATETRILAFHERLLRTMPAEPGSSAPEAERGCPSIPCPSPIANT